MKTLRFFILGFFVVAFPAFAQPVVQPGLYQANGWANPATVGNNGLHAQALLSQGFTPLYSQPTPIAEEVTPDIQALADGLQDDPLQIFNYVHDHIKLVLYFGSKKGAQLTLLEKSGNDFDQCALLVALLRAAGYSPQYSFGLMKMPLDATDGTHNDVRHWLQLTVVNTNWTTTENYFSTLLGQRGYPTFIVGYDQNTIGLQRVWVTLTVGVTNYILDPAFKVSEPLTGVDLAAVTGVSSNGIWTAAGGTDASLYVTNLNEPTLNALLTGYTTNLLNYLQNNATNISVHDVLGGWQVIPSTNTTLNQSLLFSQDVTTLPVETWDNEPTNLMSSLTINFANTNHQWWLPQLQGDRLTLLYTTNGVAQLWQDDSILTTNSTTVSDTNVIIAVNHPYGSWDLINNVLIDNGNCDQITTNVYQRTNATYCIMYAFEPEWGWLKRRQQQLDTYRQSGLSDTSREVVSESLNISGLGWMLQTAYEDRLLSGRLGVLPEYAHRLGRMGQEAGKGYYVDVYMQISAGVASSGIDSLSQNNQISAFDLNSYFWSAMEHGIIEQLQNSNLVAASSVKMIQIANTNHQAVYLANTANWSTVQTSIVGYDLTFLGNLISQGYSLLLPRSGTNSVAGTGTWKGYGVVARLQIGSYESMQMLIGGGYHGGYISSQGATLSPSYLGLSGDSQSTAFNSGSAFTSQQFRADPVDVANGTFNAESTDLSVGQAEPKGITLSRTYNGTRRASNPSGMADGWVNNYTMTANALAAPQVSLGNTTPAQMAPMLVAATAASIFYNGPALNPKNWSVTALIAKWGIDQITHGGVSISLGKDTVQFIKQPNGDFTPPGNCSMTLMQTNSVFWLKQRHANTFKFNAKGFLTNIVDQYNQSLSITYNGSNWVSTVKDWQNHHTFTFTYTGTPSRLTSISDGTRTVQYGYSTLYNAQGDLTSFTDAEGKISRYQYDGAHNMVVTLNAQSQTVVSNNYDSLGHVTTQLTAADPSRMWHIFWSGWRTVTEDPAGDKQTDFYDDQTRLVGSQDALGNLAHTFYDGQDHIVMTVSPLNETNRFFYDNNNNAIQTVDALGYTNQYFYDSQNRLYETIDARGNPSVFGYNAQFSLAAQTNGAGNWVTYLYNATGSLASTLASKTDSGGSTTYGYDTFGNLATVTYPASLGIDGFKNNSFGDVLSHTNARGFITTFQYNNRRQLTNTIAPTNVITKIAYDAVGNLLALTDARGFATSNLWSVTRQQISTILPTTPQGTPTFTNVYDSRDWLLEAGNPLQQSVLYTNDAAHRLISITDPLARTTRLVYDTDGRNTYSTNAANQVMQQRWSGRGELIKSTQPTGRSVGYAFDPAGNQVIVTNRLGKIWQFQFDAANRLTNTISPLNHQTQLTYDLRGLLTVQREPSGQTTTNSYDAKGRLTNRVDGVSATTFRYDADDHLTNIVENLTTNVWTYDAYDRISSYKDINGNLIKYRYDVSGNMTNLVYPDGKNVYYFFDGLNRLTNVTDWGNRKTTLTYDLANRLTSITRPNGTVRTMTYDAAGEVTNIWEKTATGAVIAEFKMGWNAAARIDWEFSAPLPIPSGVPSRNATFDNDDRIAVFNGTSVTYDADGNLTSGPLCAETNATYSFDARNRLTNTVYTYRDQLRMPHAKFTTYTYDSLGQRVQVNDTQYVINPNAKLPQALMRITFSGAAYHTNFYVYAAGLLYDVDDAGNMNSYHYDLRGSTIALTDGTGSITDRVQYSPYGSTIYRSGTNDTPFLFNGRYGVMTDDNGLLYMRSRYYNPYICRFVNADPTGFSGGMNFYAYANGNPVSYLDPFGLDAVTASGGYSWVNTVSGASSPYTTQPTVVGGQVLGSYGLTTLTGLMGPMGQPFYDGNVSFSQGPGSWSSTVSVAGAWLLPGGDACNTVNGSPIGAGSMYFGLTAAPGNYSVNVSVSATLFSSDPHSGGSAVLNMYTGDGIGYTTSGSNRVSISGGGSGPAIYSTNFTVPVTVGPSGSSAPFFQYSPSVSVTVGGGKSVSGTINISVNP